MQTTNFWYQYHLYSKKIISLLLFSALCMCSFAQRNVMENDLKFARKPYHFGIHLAANFGDLKVKQNAAFALSDSILSIKSKYGIGFEIGAVISYHINKYFEFRTVPSFAFNNKNLIYQFADLSNADKKSLPQIYFDLPFEIKFKSEPLKDVKIYALAGIKYGYDIGANFKDRKKDNMPHQLQHDFGVDYGIGLEIHFPLFILAPEFKVFNSVLNIHKKENGVYSKYIDGLHNRTFTFSLNFEG
ncbi:MAG TPA: outer membrane beta-barrel protein [Chitinophagales bacterium]|nr:outer membrane beta-barrel protein [Chitinophagales bacterium]